MNLNKDAESSESPTCVFLSRILAEREIRRIEIVTDNAKVKAIPRRTYSSSQMQQQQQQQLDTKNMSRWYSNVRTNSWSSDGSVQRRPPRRRSSREMILETASIVGHPSSQSCAAEANFAHGSSSITEVDRERLRTLKISSTQKPQHPQSLHGTDNISSSTFLGTSATSAFNSPSPISLNTRNSPLVKPKRSDSLEENDSSNDVTTLSMPSSPAAALSDDTRYANHHSAQSQSRQSIERLQSTIPSLRAGTRFDFDAKAADANRHANNFRATSRCRGYSDDLSTPLSTTPFLTARVDRIIDGDPVTENCSSISMSTNPIRSIRSESTRSSSTLTLFPPQRRASLKESEALGMAAAAAVECVDDHEEVEKDFKAAPTLKPTKASGKKRPKQRRIRTDESRASRLEGGRASLLRAVEVRTPTPPPKSDNRRVAP